MSQVPRRAKRLSSLEMQKVVHEAYAFHYLAMNLGFTADELFAGCANVINCIPPGLYATVELHAQGLRFIYTLRPLVPGDDSRFMRFWTEFATSQPKRDRKELDTLVHGSEVWRTKATILAALSVKGFVLPAVEERSASEGLLAPGSRLPAPGFGGSGDVN